ncbi:nuclear transport factor 2 family protein [Actinomadura sp. DC4]|uniref:nuclear transport factor 2 family protein n=1 Tax=Actinomadura sp. DC4 TaxID=3055069 RepID=UPI0025B08187|nr:nuclear transport factor 2 family protein [Actinomadura sp. DC4]MDN3358761.1 nuclear transport factor 2 family protein [Actinomadura sp. DC4]
MERIHRYFELAVQPDLEAYYAQFADDALVEDEGRERRGIAAIREWRTEVPPVKYSVQEITESGAGHDAYAEISGGFPGSPVTLTFHFEFTADGRIEKLTIRP